MNTLFTCNITKIQQFVSEADQIPNSIQLPNSPVMKNPDLIDISDI